MDPLAEFEAEIRAFLTEHGVPPESIEISVPPDPAFGQASSNAAFLLAREWRKAPREIAAEIAGAFEPGRWTYIEAAHAAGAGFINFFLDYSTYVPRAIEAIEESGELFGRPRGLEKQRLLVEHTSVNPNKEWHIGHLRNVVIGDVLVRLARLAGHEVEVQNYIDDTGRQAAEAIFALQRYEAGKQSPSEKYDQYVGRHYVRLNAELGEHGTEQDDELQRGIETILHEMESGRYRPVIEEILEAQLQTAKRVGAAYDLLVWESDIVRAHLLQEALELLKTSPRVRVPTEGEYKGALVIEMSGRTGKGASPEGESEPMMRVLVRSNGIPTYTGKDVAYLLWKFGLLESTLNLCDWHRGEEGIRTTCPEGESFVPKAPDRVINVIAEHQALQQQTVIESLAAAGFDAEAARTHHLSYGMVSQASGRISGRKGSGISADDVLDQAVQVASQRIGEKRPDLPLHEHGDIAEAIAVGAVRYLMVQYGPVKPIVFEVEDVVSFEGDTGLYIQYAIVRMNAVLRKAAREYGLDDEAINSGDVNLLLAGRGPSTTGSGGAEQSLALKLGRFPAAVDDALRTLSVNLVADYAHTLAAEFSQFYRDCPILQAQPHVRLARLRLLRGTLRVMSNAATVLGIPIVEQL